MTLCENISLINEVQDIFTVFTMKSSDMSFENNGNRWKVSIQEIPLLLFCMIMEMQTKNPSSSSKHLLIVYIKI